MHQDRLISAERRSPGHRTRPDPHAQLHRYETRITNDFADPVTDYRRPYRTYLDAFDAARGLFFFSITWVLNNAHCAARPSGLGNTARKYGLQNHYN